MDRHGCVHRHSLHLPSIRAPPSLSRQGSLFLCFCGSPCCFRSEEAEKDLDLQTLKRKNQKPLFDALQKIKEGRIFPSASSFL